MIQRRSIFAAVIAVVFGVLAGGVVVVAAPHDVPASVSGPLVASPDASASPIPTPSLTATPTPTPSATPKPKPKPSATSEPPAEAAPPPPPPATCTDNMLTCVNIARKAEGKAPLSANSALNATAQECAERMASSGEMTHTSGPTAGFSTWGENIAVGYGSVSSVFNAWMNSNGHRINILNSAYSQMGIGYVAKGNWWCQQFGG
jgi:uncharacterized protein YkwD